MNPRISPLERSENAVRSVTSFVLGELIGKLAVQEADTEGSEETPSPRILCEVNKHFDREKDIRLSRSP